MRRGEIIEVEIETYAFGGKGIATIKRTINNEEILYDVFINNTIPGQLVKARISKKRKSYAEAKLIEVLKKSDQEIKHSFQEISGAPYISLPIKIQQKYKQKATIDIYKKLGNFSNSEELFDEFIQSPKTYDYRNKMEYSFSTIRKELLTGEELDDAFALGFKTRGTWWKVENLDKEDGLFDTKFTRQLKEIRKYLEKTNLPAWHPPKKIGFFRYLVVRKSFYKNKLLINLVTSSEGIENFNRSDFSTFMKKLLGERLAGLQHTINDEIADRTKAENGENKILYGEKVVLEKILNLTFEISMESFFQTNPKSAEKLYNKAIEYAQENFDLKNKIIMDLFCGTGTIGQIIAKQIENVKVIGVDIIEEAIQDAKRNAKRNSIDNISFYAADVGKFLKQFPKYNNNIHTIFLDPPRAGITPKTLLKVIALNAKQIVYISCNPASQAVDAKTLEENSYQFKKYSLVDQFPHTSHIESVALFIKK